MSNDVEKQPGGAAIQIDADMASRLEWGVSLLVGCLHFMHQVSLREEPVMPEKMRMMPPSADIAKALSDARQDLSDLQALI